MDEQQQRVNSSSTLARILHKGLMRTRAKILQNLGKAEKTTDDILQAHIRMFLQQQATAIKLYKELSNYINSVQMMALASKRLHSMINETYDSEWLDLDDISRLMESLDVTCSSHEVELLERVQSDLFSYTQLFRPIRNKIRKMERKLLDYDNDRHHYQVVTSSKKPDDMKLAKAKECLEESKMIYQELSSQLHIELPQFYSYRIDFLASNLSKLYSSEFKFHSELARLNQELLKLMEDVPSEEQRLAKSISDFSGSSFTCDENVNGGGGEDCDIWKQYVDMAQSRDTIDEWKDEDYINVSSSSNGGNDGTLLASLNKRGSDFCKPERSESNRYEILRKSGKQETILLAESILSDDISKTCTGKSGSSNGDIYEELNHSYMPYKPTDYQVIAIHTYKAQDQDELSFEAGEVLTVTEFDDLDKQDDGWLMGISVKTGLRGIFPENFTREISGKT